MMKQRTDKREAVNKTKTKKKKKKKKREDNTTVVKDKKYMQYIFVLF